MKSNKDIRQDLRDWVVKVSGKITAEGLSDETPIIQNRIITSLQIADLILYIEKLSGRRIEPERLKPGVFRDINTILHNFFDAQPS